MRPWSTNDPHDIHFFENQFYLGTTVRTPLKGNVVKPATNGKYEISRLIKLYPSLLKALFHDLTAYSHLSLRHDLFDLLIILPIQVVFNVHFII